MNYSAADWIRANVEYEEAQRLLKERINELMDVYAEHQLKEQQSKDAEEGERVSKFLYQLWLALRGLPDGTRREEEDLLELARNTREELLRSHKLAIFAHSLWLRTDDQDTSSQGMAQNYVTWWNGLAALDHFKTAIQPYLKHLPPCPGDQGCTCGLNKLICLHLHQQDFEKGKWRGKQCMDCNNYVEPPVMKIGFDIGGVLSKYPQEFRPLIRVLQQSGEVEIFVITDIQDHAKSVELVQGNGYNIPADHILNSDYDGKGELCKADLIKQHGIQVFVDDFPGYCNHTECVSLMVWPNPFRPYYHEQFKTDGSEGNFGRKASK